MRVRATALIAVVLLTVLIGGGNGVGRQAEAQTNPTPAVPEELRPVLAVLGPIASPACGAAGLAGTLIGGEAQNNPPLLLLLDALQPVFLTCALLPPSPTPTRCGVDQPVTDTVLTLLPAIGNLLVLPEPAGQSIDSLAAVELLVLAATGAPLEPQAAELLRTLLDCEQDLGGDEPDDGAGPIDLSEPPPPTTSTPPVATAPPTTSIRPPVAAGTSPGPVAPTTTAPELAVAPTPVASPLPRTASDWAKLATALCLFALLAPLAAQRRALPPAPRRSDAD